jgi:DNA polymerase I-like protein with 3'-5' exonuclease and polymerase domains/uracil-DNA glycosylase
MQMDFFPTGPSPARIMIVGEAPGEREVEQRAPFVGPSGHELTRMLEESGLQRSQCFLTNVCRIRPYKNDIEKLISKNKRCPQEGWTQLNGLWVAPEIVAGQELLFREILECQPQLVIAFGNLALWALTGEWGIKKWRGSLIASSVSGTEPFHVLPTYHPAAILRQYALRPTVCHDLKKGARFLLDPTITKSDKEYIVRPSFSQVQDWFATTRALLADNSRLILAADLETRAGHIACIGIATNEREAICIPLMCTENLAGYWSVEEEAWIIKELRSLLCSESVLVVGQNWLYDAQYIWRHWLFSVPTVYDTMIGQHAIFSTSQKSLDYLTSMYAEDYVYWKDEGKNWDPKLPEEQLWKYNCDDCINTLKVYYGQQQAIDEMEGWPKLRSVVDFQTGKLFHPVLRTMNRGIKPNLALKSKMAIDLMAAATERNEWLTKVIGRELNINSSPQMKQFFYEEMNQKKNYKRGKPGEPMTVTCDDAALEKIAAAEPILRPIIRRIQELRSIGVFLSTFVMMTLDRDGRIRCTFNIAGTKTYRFSSSRSAFNSGTNLQNVPSGEELEEGYSLPNVRQLFCPDEGKEMFDIDLDSADLRIVTWDSGCVGMKEMFAANLKPYVEISKEYYHDPSITKSHPAYKQFKALCHGTNYLGTPPGLAQRIGLLVHEVERIQRWYFGKFPEIKKWQEDTEKQVKGRGWIENVFGYRCYFKDRITDKTINEAVAWKPQSTVGCLINRAYVAIDETLPWAEILLQVHDSLAGQYPAVMGGEARRAIVQASQIPLSYESGDLIIPVGIKTSQVSWGDCK